MPKIKQANLDTFSDKIVNTLPGNCVVVNNEGEIVKVNLNWSKFAVENGIEADINSIGQNYLEVCKKLMGISKESAGEVRKAIKAIFNGVETDFELECQGQKIGETQRFRIQASGFEFEGSSFATIFHQDITEYSNVGLAVKKSESNLLETNKQLLAEISEKNLSERKTEKSNLDFNLLVNSSPGVIYRCCLDDPWEMHFISDKIETLSGYPKEDFLGLNPIRPFGEIMHPDDREEASRLVQIAIDKKESYKLAYRVIHKDGHINYVFGYGQASYKSDGAPDYLVGIIFNDTDRVVAINKVKESEENYRTLIEQANDGIVVLQDTKIIFANSALTRITGYSVEELTGSNFIDFIDEKELGKVKANYVKRMNGEYLGAYESKIVHKNGSVIDVEFNGRLTQYKGQVADLAMVRDITERKMAKEELLISEERYRLLFTGSQNGILFTDTDTMQIKYANPAISKILGYSEKELLQMRVPDIHPTSSHELVNHEFNVHIKEEPNFVYALPCLTKDNKIIYANVSASEFTTSSGKFRVGFFTDITKYILAEEERNRLFNLSSDLICIVDFKGVLKQINPAWKEIIGYEKEEILGKSILNFIHSDDIQKTTLEVEKLNSGNKTVNFENRYRNKNGSIRYISWRSSPLVEEQKIYAIGRDVTESKLAEIAIIESEEKYRNLIEHLKDGVILIQDDVVKFTNQTMCSLTGYSEEEFIGKEFMDFINLDELSKVLDKYSERDVKSDWEPYEISLVLKNGNTLDFEFTAAPTIFQGEDAILVVARDISERKKVEEALAENEKKFRLLVEQSPLPILILNPDGFIDKVNRSWQKMWSLSDEGLSEVMERYNILSDKLSIELGHTPHIEKAFQGEASVTPLAEYDGVEALRRFGVQLNADKLWIQVSYYPVKDSNGNVVKVVGLVDDRTESKQNEQEILDYQKRLQDLALELTYAEEKQRKEIATDLHDDVGQLLASSRIQIATINDSMEKATILNKVQNVSSGLRNVIEATQQAIFELNPPQLNEIGIEAAIADWAEEELEIKHGISIIVLGDHKKYDFDDGVRYLLFRCVRELLINVIKHAQATKVMLNFVEKDNLLSISVQDNGVGFNYKPNEVGKKGSGFGLFSVQERIHNIGGVLDIDTVSGTGTKITLTIPI